MKPRYLLFLVILTAPAFSAFGQCVPGLDTARLMPHGYAIPEGTTADITLKISPQAGVRYTLFHNELPTGQVLESTAGIDSLVWSVTKTGVYTVVARQGDCEQVVSGYCLVSVFPTTPNTEASESEASQGTDQFDNFPENEASINSEPTANNSSCSCGSPSIQPATLDLCGESSGTIVVQGGLITGFYSLLRNGNPVRQINLEDCNIILWENITNLGNYTVQGPNGCSVSGATEVIKTDNCNGGNNCGTGANIDWPVSNPPPYNLCQGNVSLFADQERDSYAWYYSPDLDGSGPVGELIGSNQSITVNQTGTYTLRTPDNCGNPYETAIPLTFNPPMGTVTLEGRDPWDLTSCDDVTYYVARGRHVGYFQWDISQLGEGNTISYVTEQSGNERISTATVTWSDTYAGQATLGVTAYGCGGTSVVKSLTITAGTYAGPDLTVYQGSAPVSLDDATPPGGTWAISPGNAAEALTAHQFHPGHPSVAPGTYTLTYTSGCPISDTRTITVQSLSNNYNYVAQDVFRVSGVTPATMNSRSVTQRSRHYTYLDGQARTTQEVQWRSSPNQSSLRQSVEYDELSRVDRQYLPYVAGGSGDYQDNGTLGFYSNPPAGVAGDSKPYALTDYEASPLSRPRNTTGPGNAWHQANKKATYKYQVTTGGSVYKLSIGRGRTDLPVSNGTYGAGELALNEASDEDGRTSRSYTNKSGETVLREVQDDSGWLATYYVYDDYGNLRYVLPPRAVQQIGSTFSGTAYQNVLQQLAFRYVFNERQRMIFRRTPGTDAGTEMVYDERDRLVLSQNARQAELNQWSFVKYDALNRPVMTGVYSDSRSRSDLETAIATKGFAESRTGGTVGYSLTNSFPSVSEADVRTVTYYDDYGFTDYSYNGDKIAQPIGQTTGSRTRVLGGNTWLTTVVWYDYRHRVVHTVSENHKGGTDEVTHTYDFVGNLLTRTHQHSNISLTLRETYRYDHADRLLEVTHQTDSESAVTVAEYKYNELGEVIEKNLHRRGSDSFAQSVDYRYNIRGWLQHINGSALQPDATVNPDTGQAADLFGLDLLYHSNPPGLDE